MGVKGLAVLIVAGALVAGTAGLPLGKAGTASGKVVGRVQSHKAYAVPLGTLERGSSVLDGVRSVE